MNDNQKTDQGKNAASGVSVQSQPQAQSVGFPHKEQEPARSFIERSDVELEVGKELTEIGVKANRDTINLSDVHKEIGVTHAGASVPVSTSPSGMVQLPVTAKQTKKNIKKTKPTDSLRGLLLEILKNIQRIGLKEQEV